MLNPNFNLLLWILLISYSIGAVARIIAGSIKMEKSSCYTYGDGVVGVLDLVLVAWVILG